MLLKGRIEIHQSQPDSMTQALSTLTCFQTKTEMFCSILHGQFASTLIVFILFTPSTIKRRISVLKTLLYPQCACSNKLYACAFQYIGLQNWCEIEGTWWRLFAILDSHGWEVWRPVVSILLTSPFSDSIVFSIHTTKQRFQIAPLWRAFSNGSVFGDHFWHCSVDDGSIQSKRAPFSFEKGLVWTGPLKSVFEWLRFWCCSVDDSCIQGKTAPFSFENGLAAISVDGALEKVRRSH